MPKHFITYLFGKLASLKAGFITTGVIKAFVHHYKVDMQEAKESNPANFATFNDFFVRELKENVRPIDNNAQMLCLPADACVSQAGKIENGRLIQAKGHTFDACELLGGDQNLAAEFTDGHFATLYLSPRDYHRVHMPCEGKLRQMIYIPGDLFSVNPLTAESVFNLFARNERVVCIFETDFGPMAQVLVGATIVGSVETPWHGTVMPPREKSIRRWEYPEVGEQSITLKKGEEMGRFKLGSTVINLFAKDAIAFVENIIPGQATKMGAAYAEKVTVSTECNPVSDEADSK